MSDLSKYEQNIVSNIEEFGWSRMGVFPREGHSEDGPAFAYSIGFTKTLGVPEVIIFGLGFEVMHQMLWSMFDAIKAGKSLVHGARWDTPLPDNECETRAVHSAHLIPDYFNSAMWHWETYLKRQEPFEAFQLFWPGVRDRLLPWEEGSHQSVIDAQPRLDLPLLQS